MSILELICCLLISTATIEGLESFKQSECGRSKSCLRWSSCDFPSCDYAASWKHIQYNSTDYLQIELVGKISVPTGYIAMGFSNNQLMMDNGVVACCFNDSNFNIVAGYNLPHKNYLLQPDQYDKDYLVTPNDTLYGIEFDSPSSILRCRFLRLMNPVLNGDKLKNLTGGIKYFVLTAKGALRSTGLGYHGPNKRPSYLTYDFQSNHWDDNIIGPGNILIKLHACFMIVGWVFFATNGIMMAYFYKGNWPDKKFLGNKIWFQIHRCLQPLCVIFTCAGFVMIFVKVGAYSSLGSLPNAAHPVMGIVTTGLMLTNVIMALFRCHPNDPSRWIFNRLHSIVGTSAYVLAISTIVIGIQLPQAGNNLSGITYPWSLVIVFLCLIILLFIYGKIRKKNISEVSIASTVELDLNYSIEEKRSVSGIEVIVVSLVISVGFGIAFICFVLML